MDAHVDMWWVPTIPLTERVANIYKHLQYKGGIQSLTWDFGFGIKFWDANEQNKHISSYLWLLCFPSTVGAVGRVHSPPRETFTRWLQVTGRRGSVQPQLWCSADHAGCLVGHWSFQGVLGEKDMHQRTESIENTWGIKRKPHVEKTHHHPHFQPKKNINLPTTTNQQNLVRQKNITLYHIYTHSSSHCRHQMSSIHIISIIQVSLMSPFCLK